MEIFHFTRDLIGFHIGIPPPEKHARVTSSNVLEQAAPGQSQRKSTSGSK